MASTVLATTAITLVSVISVFLGATAGRSPASPSSSSSGAPLLVYGSKTGEVFAVKYLAISLCFMLAFVCNVQAIRLYAHASFLLGLPPVAGEGEGEAAAAAAVAREDRKSGWARGGAIEGVVRVAQGAEERRKWPTAGGSRRVRKRQRRPTSAEEAGGGRRTRMQAATLSFWYTYLSPPSSRRVHLSPSPTDGPLPPPPSLCEESIRMGQGRPATTAVDGELIRMGAQIWSGCWQLQDSVRREECQI
nr:uncharacterized protein LOC9268603 isoform X3 [Oryza sativa Japonica Group]